MSRREWNVKRQAEIASRSVWLRENGDNMMECLEQLTEALGPMRVSPDVFNTYCKARDLIKLCPKVTS